MKNKDEKNSLQGKVNQEEINFDYVLKCSDYSYDEKYFITADYGCIYDPAGKNIYGNLMIYLIPKKELQLRDDQIAEDNDRVNSLTIANYKKDFKIFIYLIDKQFLNYNKQADPIYYQKKAYQEKLYTYDDKLNKWIFVDEIKVLNESDDEKEQIWRNDFINKQLVVVK